MPSTAIITRIDPKGAAHMERSALFRPASYREADNSIEVVWSIGAAGLRFDWLDGGYYIEELSMKPGAVRLERLNAGAVLLDSHAAGSLKAVLGSVVPGSARIADGKGTARVRLATTPDVADTNAKIIDGHIRSLSVSYHVHEFERTEKVGEHPHMLATDWEPTEISMVAVPFDAGAQVRSRSRTMPLPADDTHDNDLDLERPPVRNAPERRSRPVTIARIRELCGRTDDISRSLEREMIEDHADTPLTERAVLQRIADELISIRERPSVDTRTGGENGSPNQLAERMTGALYARMSGRAPDEASREFMGASLVDMARGLLEARGERVRWANASAVVQRMGAHTTSDFPLVMSNAAGRYLVDVIRDYPSPLRPLARARTANDFRQLTILKTSANPALLVVKENGEFKRGSIAESQEGYKLSTYGRIFGISRQAIINDDLGAFTSVFTSWGRAGAELEAGLLASLITGTGPVMADTKTLYHVDHKNLAPAGTAITIAALSQARQAMRSQTEFDGNTPLNIAPKYLVVGAAKETEAEAVLATLAASTVGEVNPFSGKLELIVDARLPGNGWRLFADPASWPVLEEARLAGQEDVFVDSRVGFDIDGIETKARLDIGAAAIDHHGTYYNPGAAPA